MSLSFGKKEPKDMLAKASRDSRRMEDAELAKDSDAMSDALMDVSVSLASVRHWLRAHASKTTSFVSKDIDACEALSVPLDSFRDVANELKHGGRPSRDSETADVLLSAPSSQLPVSADDFPRMKIIRKDRSRHRALDLARSAINDWEAFLRAHRLL
jgi:hypothetical protein